MFKMNKEIDSNKQLFVKLWSVKHSVIPASKTLGQVQNDFNSNSEFLSALSIIPELSANYIRKFINKHRYLLIFCWTFTFAFFTAHDFLLLTKQVTYPNMCPLICNQWQVLLLTIINDFGTIVFFGYSIAHKADFTEYDEKWCAIDLCKDIFFMKKLLKTTRKEMFLFRSVYLTCWTFAVSCFVGQMIANNITSGKLSLAVHATHIIFYIIIPVLSWSEIYSIYVSSLIIKATFKMIGQQMQSHAESYWNADNVRYYRIMYFQTVELSKSADKIWSLILSLAYPFLNIFWIIILFYLISEEFDSKRFVFFGVLSFNVLWALWFINRYVVGINIEAASLYDTIYNLTLLTTNSDSIKEISIFLKYVGRKDIGYSFVGMFIFSPGLMATMITLSVSVIIAFPSFISG